MFIVFCGDGFVEVVDLGVGLEMKLMFLWGE